MATAYSGLHPLSFNQQTIISASCVFSDNKLTKLTFVKESEACVYYDTHDRCIQHMNLCDRKCRSSKVKVIRSGWHRSLTYVRSVLWEVNVIEMCVCVIRTKHCVVLNT